MAIAHPVDSSGLIPPAFHRPEIAGVNGEGGLMPVCAGEAAIRCQRLQAPAIVSGAPEIGGHVIKGAHCLDDCALDQFYLASRGCCEMARPVKPGEP